MNANINKCYETLGLKPPCTAEEIKAAYRKQAKEWHPDICQAPEATEKFKEIQQAYETLSGDKLQQNNFTNDIFRDMFKRGSIDNVWEQFFNTSMRDNIKSNVKIELEFDKLSFADSEKLLKAIKDAGFDIKRYSIIRNSNGE